MRFTGKVWAVLMVFALTLILTSTGFVYAQDSTPEVGVFESIEVAPGETVQVPISIRNVKDLYGVDITLKFDPALVQVEDADPSASGIQAALGEFLDPGLLLFNTADNDAGTYHFVMAQYNPSEPKSGEGILLVITFKGINEGVTDLTVSALTLASSEGVEIPSSGMNSSLTVRAGAPVQAATIPVVQSTALVVLKTFTPVPTDTPVPTVAPTSVIEPTGELLETGNTVKTPQAGSKGEDVPGFWLVNNWWIVLILLFVVIAAGLYLFVFKNKSAITKE